MVVHGGAFGFRRIFVGSVLIHRVRANRPGAPASASGVFLGILGRGLGKGRHTDTHTHRNGGDRKSEFHLSNSVDYRHNDCLYVKVSS
jgi:hypothetical protein